jgi:hypothetical protein
LRAFDQRHHLTRELAAQLNDPRQDDRVLSDHFKSGQRLSVQNRPTGLAVRD